MNLTELIRHPEKMDRDTLYDLRSLLALYPYYQTARVLMLQNLYLLHDATFDEELRRAALYISDRKVIFNMVEAAHYKLRPVAPKADKIAKQGADRTVALIDDFLESIPDDDTKPKKRKPTPADATVDYVAFLLESETEEKEPDTPLLIGHDLIDNFINNEKGKITLQDDVQYTPEIEEEEQEAHTVQGEYATETLARIYIRQKRYDKALSIIKKIDRSGAKHSIYIEDQIRFLEKLILINKTNQL